MTAARAKGKIIIVTILFVLWLTFTLPPFLQAVFGSAVDCFAKGPVCYTGTLEQFRFRADGVSWPATLAKWSYIFLWAPVLYKLVARDFRNLRGFRSLNGS